MKLNQRELGTILAALRYWQAKGCNAFDGLGHRQAEAIDDIATDDGEVDPLSADEIDMLCERINCEE